MLGVMTRKQTERQERLLPKGIPRYVRCYDNGGESADRYTVCFTGKAGALHTEGYSTEYCYRAMSAAPFHPQGVGIWGSSKNHHCDVNRWGFAPAIGRKNHLGTRIPFEQLPKDCKRLVLCDYKEIWEL